MSDPDAPVPAARPACYDFAMSFLGEPEAPEVDAYVKRLEAALQRWKCPACGGRGKYLNRGPGARAAREPGYRHPAEELLDCRKCDGKGLDPIAHEALTRKD